MISRELASCVEALVAQEEDALPLMHQLNPLQIFLMKVAASAVISALVVAWHDRPRGWCSKDLVQVSLARQAALGSIPRQVAYRGWRSKDVRQAGLAGRAAAGSVLNPVLHRGWRSKVPVQASPAGRAAQVLQQEVS